MKVLIIRWIALILSLATDVAERVAATWRQLWEATPPTWSLPRQRRSDVSQMSPEQRMRRGQEAAALLRHPLLVEAMQYVEESLAYARRRVPLSDGTMHTRLIVAGQQWDLMRSFLEQAVVTGQLDRAALLKREGVASRVRQAWQRPGGIRA